MLEPPPIPAGEIGLGAAVSDSSTEVPSGVQQEEGAAKCPACGSMRVFRSHRQGALEIWRSRFGSYPHRCHACKHRYFLKKHGGVETALDSDKRPETRQKARARFWRECVMYGCALAAFLAFLYFMIREPAP